MEPQPEGGGGGSDGDVRCLAPTFQLQLTPLGRAVALLLDQPAAELVLLLPLPDLTPRVLPRQARERHLAVAEVALPSPPRRMLVTHDGLFRRPLLLLSAPVKEVRASAVAQHLGVWEEKAGLHFVEVIACF